MWIYFFSHFKDFYGFFSQILFTTACERQNVFSETYPKQFIAFPWITSLQLEKQQLFQFWLILIQNSRIVLGYATIQMNPILI